MLSLRCFKPPGSNYKAGLLSDPPKFIVFSAERTHFVFCACFLRHMEYQIFMGNDFSALFV